MNDAKTSYSKEDILTYCLHDPATKRRLPAPPFLMFDRIVDIRTDGGKFGKGYIVAEKDVQYDEWFFFCHFQGDPVMPGVLQVDAILQLGGFFLMHSGHDGHGRAMRTGKISFREQVRPHHKLVSYTLDFKKVSARPTPMAFADAHADVDGVLSAEVEGIVVGMFSNLSYTYPDVNR